MKKMFFGKWDLRIDEKWRLHIPAVIRKQFNNSNSVILYEDNDGCLRIEKPPLSQSIVYPSAIYIIDIKKGRRGRESEKWFLVPKYLRGSTSFYYGRKVTLVGRGNYLEIWPRP